MGDKSDEKYLKQCFKDIISTVNKSIDQLQPKQSQSQSDIFHKNSVLSTGVYTFTLNKFEEEKLDILKEEIQCYINQYRTRLSHICKRYLYEFLNQFHYDEDEQKFSSSFTMDSLHPFECSLRGASASIDAFTAAWDGNLQIVKDFIQNYPTLKDKPGLHGTTLLYSAARNNHMSLVKYLIENAHCAVNAQNLQELEKALFTTKKGGHYSANPSAASTALHGACFNGNLDVVKYLIENGADYFIQNQARETPIKNGLGNENIRRFFEDFLILGYSQISKTPPEEPLDEKLNTGIFDCIWEYKVLSDKEWNSFSINESNELNQSLLIKPDQEIKQDIYLKGNSLVYNISLIQFLRSTKTKDEKNQLSWIRCRGSSLWNFNCNCLWQIMIIEHPNLHSNNEPSLKTFDIPLINNSRFKLQFNSWYNCTTQLSSEFDKAINYRRKQIIIDIDFISKDEFIFNLHSFTFTNQQKTIIGYIRWIPKFPSKIGYRSNKINNIDNVQKLSNIHVESLNKRRHKQISRRNYKKSLFDDDSDFEYDENEDDNQPSTRLNADEDDDDDDDDDDEDNDRKENAKNRERGRWSLYDLQKGDDTDTESVMSDDTASLDLNDYLNEHSDQIKKASIFDESTSSIHRQELESIKVELEKKKHDNENLQAQLTAAQEEMQRQKTNTTQKSTKQKEELDKLSKKIEELNIERQKNEIERSNQLKMEKAIKPIDYKNIQIEIVQDFLTPKFYQILNYLKQIKTQFINYQTDKIPKMQFEETINGYTVTILGFQEHHDTFKSIVTCIRELLRLKQGAIDFHQRKLNQRTNSIKKTIYKVKQKTSLWKQYSKNFIQLLDEKSNQFLKKFYDYIQQISKSLIEQCILNDLNTIRNEIRKQTNQFIQDNFLIKEIEIFKQQAFEEFIKQNIILQRNYHEKKPSNKSISVLEKLIDKTRNLLKTNSSFIGHELKHFNLIPDLLQQVIVYYSCFNIQLPLFESAVELLDKIEKNTVTTIATSTGSGKSSLLPALLAAEGYDKIIVTQPRRLPCTLICNRVNATMTPVTDQFSPQIAGWAVSGAESNQNAKILYLTDGLLKERLLYDENFITRDTQLNKSIIFFLDEVHERSVNIDHCLALLARILKLKPDLQSKMKLIISSATLDASVPKLFHQITNLKCSEFEMTQMGTLYPVTKCARPNANILNIVQELYQERRRYDQILCFVSSVKEVNEYCTLIKKITNGAITAYPLIQSQQASVQQDYIDNGSVFFSTTVAETSLTFPQLKYVIDTGMINVPVYDPKSKRTILKIDRAAESTIKQRLGRLGRTQPGIYYSLYDFNVEDKKYPTPQICQSDLMNIEFSLRKSPIKQGLNYMKEFLPDKPAQYIIDHTIEELRKLDILEKGTSEALTNNGKALGKLPDFGSLAMSKCVLAALKEFNCGADLIALSSILSVLNTTTLLKSIPKNYKSPDGDFMTLLNVMEEILVVKQSVPTKEFSLDRICQAKGLSDIKHILRQALRRYNSLEKSFNLSVDYRAKAQIKSHNWELIARSLLSGYYDNIFVSAKELFERTHLYIQYNGSTEDNIAELDSQSVLGRSTNKIPPALVLARDIRYSTSIRSKAILSFVGTIKPEWIEHSTKRQLKINSEEEVRLNSNNIFTNALSKFSNKITMLLTKTDVNLSGQAGIVFNSESHLLQEMVEQFQFNLDNKNPPNTAQYTNLARNLESIMKMPHIFNPMKWRWENQKQITITVNCNTSTNICEVTVNGRNSEYKNVKNEFGSFLSWLQECAVIRHPNSGVSPRVFRPQVRSKYLDIEERISHITDEKRTTIDLYNGVKGINATRETRMEVVAWIAVCKFFCRLEGGFVRDWIVGQYTSRPANPPTASPKDWISYMKSIPYINKEVVPADLDCHLPTHKYFDIEKFHDELYKHDITCKIFRQDWRYVLLIDENAKTGPFTMDLIEPHVALTQDRIDFDVNNLSLEKDYTHELGMRVDIQQRPYLIELETIVENIKNKRFQVLRPIDKHLIERINKMVEIRKWTQIGQPFLVVPNPNPKYSAVLVPLPSSTTLYKDLEQKMKIIGTSVKILSIEQVKNPLLEDTYESMKKIIAKQCTGFNPNERELFHGTKGPGIDGIRDDGFDDRYFSPTGNWGHGAYFADDPKKSNGYTNPDPTDGTRVMYYSKVLLGNESKQTTVNQKLVAAPVKFHSVVGTLNGFTEYIVYRYGQALPYMKILYTS
ncbi:unnamed protein product [Rotaria sordida]|uniref:Poly [ADP-ribose] polymerase n=1 Tax=Rotaria sordida TaxID=392033 RepID=A0A814KG60_9BILA|nr:unnamed protein product [Rotaria sordida]CAF3759942.1 unnamed protein product [Rotaria sordida]